MSAERALGDDPVERLIVHADAETQGQRGAGNSKEGLWQSWDPEALSPSLWSRSCKRGSACKSESLVCVRGSKDGSSPWGPYGLWLMLTLPREAQNLLAFHPARWTRGHSQEAGLGCSSAPPTVPCRWSWNGG